MQGTYLITSFGLYGISPILSLPLALNISHQYSQKERIDCGSPLAIFATKGVCGLKILLSTKLAILADISLT